MRVVVVGGGFSGLAAAIALQERRHEVLLLERRGVLGGRAASFRDAASREDVDNGTHVLFAGWSATLGLLRQAGAQDLLLAQEALRFDFADEGTLRSLVCPKLVAPFHLAGGVLGLSVPWPARMQMARLVLRTAFGPAPRGHSLARHLEATGQGDLARTFWRALAILLLGDAPEALSAERFHAFCRHTLLRSHDAARLVFLRRGQAEVHERLARYLESRGGLVHRRALVHVLEVDGGRVQGVRYLQRAETREEIRSGKREVMYTVPADAVVAAVPWATLPQIVPEGFRDQEPFASAARLASRARVSVEVWLDQVVLPRPLVALADAEVTWAADKGRLFGREGPPQHLSLAFDPARVQEQRSNAELTAAAEAGLRRLFPAMEGARVTRSLVLREPEAAYATDDPGLRPACGPGTPVEGLVVAGDWTDAVLPLTIEGAVRSGFAAARALEGSR